MSQHTTPGEICTNCYRAIRDGESYMIGGADLSAEAGGGSLSWTLCAECWHERATNTDKMPPIQVFLVFLACLLACSIIVLVAVRLSSSPVPVDGEPAPAQFSPR